MKPKLPGIVADLAEKPKNEGSEPLPTPEKRAEGDLSASAAKEVRPWLPDRARSKT